MRVAGSAEVQMHHAGKYAPLAAVALATLRRLALPVLLSQVNVVQQQLSPEDAIRDILEKW